MSKPKLLALGGVILILGGLITAVLPTPEQVSIIPMPESMMGVVTDVDGTPIAEAIVQIQGTPRTTETTEDGLFSFDELGGTDPVVFTAWAPGHFIGWTTVDPQEANGQFDDLLHITLNLLPQRDNYQYDWFSEDEVQGSAACGLCHREYKEWQLDQHSQASINPRFVTMYTGRNIEGEIGQRVQWGMDGIPLPPDPDLPYTGPGFLPDHPGGQAGNCATCHAPAAAKISNQQTCAWSGCHSSLTIERSNGLIAWPPMPVAATGHAAEGISCEICHKIGDVILDPETLMPWPDSPGILSLRLYRPFDESEQVFFGTLIDVAAQDSYLPLLSESRFCAACHFGVFGGVMGDRTVSGGTVIYNSYGEWLESSYSDPETGQTCQTCHMEVSDANWIVLAERGGIERDYATLHNHTMLGVNNEEFMRNAVTMQSSAQRIGDQIAVEVNIINDNTGHHIPSDSPLRSMMLVVLALDADGQPLALLDGPVNPDFAGDYGGLPGRTFAKVLRDEWSGETPTGAFWRPVTIVQDNRIAAMATDRTEYTFAAPTADAVTIDVRLIYRRAFYTLMAQKGWNNPDLLMKHDTLLVPAN